MTKFRLWNSEMKRGIARRVTHPDVISGAIESVVQCGIDDRHQKDGEGRDLEGQRGGVEVEGDGCRNSSKVQGQDYELKQPEL